MKTITSKGGRPKAPLILERRRAAEAPDLGVSAQEHPTPRHPRQDRPGLRRGPGQQGRRRPAPRQHRDRRQVAEALPGGPPRRADRRTPARRPAQDHRRPGRGGRHQDPGGEAQGRHPLEHPRHGPGRRAVPERHRPDLERLRAEAPQERDLQALDRPLLRREGPRRRRAVHEPAGERHRPVGRREEPGAGVGPHPTAAADDPRAGRARDPRLRPQRDDVAVRRVERGHRGR